MWPSCLNELWCNRLRDREASCVSGPRRRHFLHRNGNVKRHVPVRPCLPLVGLRVPIPFLEERECERVNRRCDRIEAPVGQSSPSHCVHGWLRAVSPFVNRQYVKLSVTLIVPHESLTGTLLQAIQPRGVPGPHSVPGNSAARLIRFHSSSCCRDLRPYSLTLFRLDRAEQGATSANFDSCPHGGNCVSGPPKPTKNFVCLPGGA
jgi:hypothetical protein